MTTRGGNMNFWRYVFFNLALFDSFMSSQGMGLCDFAAKFPCEDNWGEAGSKRPGCMTRCRKKTTQYAATDQATTEAIIGTKNFVATDQATTDLLIRTSQTCPPIMIYSNCSACQGTCIDPCIGNCSKHEMCICPDGFLFKGNCCVPEECECFVEGVGVLTESSIHISQNCTKRYFCTDGKLTCEDYQCDTNAICEEINNMSQCHCSTGYTGDGINCTAILDCQDVYDRVSNQSGIYKIKPTTWQGEPFKVYCNMSNGGGWTVFQRRIDGSQSFFRSWSNYKDGFGIPDGEIWLGNEKLHSVTSQKNYELRVDVVNSFNVPFYVIHNKFYTSEESDNYRLRLGNKSEGNAGDALNVNNGCPFSTYDRDNDHRANENCATRCVGIENRGPCLCSNNAGWWYKNSPCSTAHLNSPCDSACFRWYEIPQSTNGRLKYAEMKIRPHL